MNRTGSLPRGLEPFMTPTVGAASAEPLAETGPPLRILVGADVPPDPNAGASGTVYQMNRALEQLGHSVDEIWADELGRRIRHGNLHYWLELPRSYRAALRRRANRVYDVIELNQPHAYLATAEHQRCRRPGVIVNRSHGHEVRSEEVLTPWRMHFKEPAPSGLRGMVSAFLRRQLDGQWDQVAQTADGFHVSCHEDQQYLIERYRVAPENIGVISQGIPELYASTPPKPFTANRLNRLLYVGQNAFFKAPMVLIEIASRLLTSHKQLEMTWVCSPAHHAAIREQFPAELRSRVTLLPWMPQEQLIHVIDDHGLFVFPSFFEGFGKAPLEAMSRGLCVVASNAGGMRDFISDGVTGRLVPPGDVSAAVAAVESLLSSIEACQAMSARAAEAAQQHRWTRCAAQLVTFYRSLIARKQASAINRTASA
jgi:glycosyltransferase involved in cell wall biosynthesis